MSLIVKNPWGLAMAPNTPVYEAQRKDLWSLGMDAVVAGITAYNVPGYSNALPPAAYAHVYARSVSFPEIAIEGKSFSSPTVPINYPDMDTALGQIRVVFVTNVNTGNGDSSPTAAALQAFLEAWRTVIRAGRYGFSNESVPILSQSTNYRYNYRFDIPVTLYGGISSVFIGDIRYDSSTGLSPSSQYILKNAWLASYQPGELEYDSGNQIHTITATLYAETILSPLAASGTSRYAAGPVLGVANLPQPSLFLSPTVQPPAGSDNPSTANGTTTLVFPSITLPSQTIQEVQPPVGSSNSAEQAQAGGDTLKGTPGNL